MKIHYMQVLACNRSTCIQPRCHQTVEHWWWHVWSFIFCKHDPENDERDELRAPQKIKIKKRLRETRNPNTIDRRTRMNRIESLRPFFDPFLSSVVHRRAPSLQSTIHRRSSPYQHPISLPFRNILQLILSIHTPRRMDASNCSGMNYIAQYRR